MPHASAHRVLREASLELARLRRVRGAYRTTWRRIARARARLAVAAALLAAAPLPGAAAAGTPVFQPRLLFDGTLDTPQPAFADIDGDGDFDVLSGRPDGNVYLFENTGMAAAPDFSAPLLNPFGIPASGRLAAPAFADIDADGDLDAFVGDADGGTDHFRNTGTASTPAFMAGPSDLPDVGSSASPAFADIDADGDLDAFAGNELGNTFFFRNLGSPSAPVFAAASTNPFGLGNLIGAASPSFADIDGDGDLDGLIGQIWGLVAYFRNTGSASAPAFATLIASSLPRVGPRASPDFADLDGDGDLDAILGDYTKTLLLENTGTASTPVFSMAGNPLGATNVGSSARPTFADLDGDGDLDAFVGTYHDAGMLFLRNTGSATAPAFTEPSTNPFGLANVGYGGAPVLADIDGDGDLDSFSGVQNGNVVFFANTGTAGAPAFGPPSTNPFGLADVGNRAHPAFADLDADGDLDAFVGDEGGRTFYFANTGSASAPAFAAPSMNPFGLVNVAFSASPTVADVDGDGDLDALVGSDDGQLTLFANTGSAGAPAFAAPAVAAFGLADVGYSASPELADLDGDGDLDAFVGEYGGAILLFENVEFDADACTDGIDNDSDGQVDFGPDPGCASAADTDERSSRQCDNGIDDDGDAKIDRRTDGSGDPHCASLTDNREAPDPPVGCGLGPELLLLGPLFAAVRKRRGSYTAPSCPSLMPPPTSSSSAAR